MLQKYFQLKQINLLGVDKQQFIKRQKIKYDSSFSKNRFIENKTLKINNKLC